MKKQICFHSGCVGIYPYNKRSHPYITKREKIHPFVKNNLRSNVIIILSYLALVQSDGDINLGANMIEQIMTIFIMRIYVSLVVDVGPWV